MTKTKENIMDYSFIFAGVIVDAIGLNGFLLPNSYIEGGATGISILGSNLFHAPLALLLIILNLPAIILSYRQLSPKFAFRTMFSIMILAISLYFIKVPTLTSDKILVPVFGGFFLGLGSGLVIRGGGAIDGSEIFSLYFSKGTSFSFGDIVFLINTVIFISATFVIGIDKSLYSILIYLISAKTIEYVCYGIEEYRGITVISDYSAEIKDAVISQMSRGVTIYKGKGGYGSANSFDKEIIFTVITRLETSKLKSIVYDIDPKAFYIEHPISDIKGGVIKKQKHRH